MLLAIGVMLLADAYTGARHGAGWARPVFWTGQLLIYVPVAARLLHAPRRAIAREGLPLVAALTTAQYLVACCYSPQAFTFPDELQHWRTTRDILTTGHLFSANYSLPISPRFPALENITAAVCSLTGLPIHPAGLIVAGLAHLLLTTGICLLIRQASGSPRIAALAAALYATSPHFAFFDAMYSYQTLAMPFAVLALHAAAHLTRRGAAGWWPIAMIAAATTVTAHHVTGLVLATAAALLAAVTAALHGRRPGIRAGLFALGCAALLTTWVAAVAPGTIGYLRPAAHLLLDGVHGAFGGHAAGGGTGSTPPLDAVAGYATVLLITVGLPLGWYRIWRTHRRPLPVTLAIASAGYFPVLAIRLTSPDGSELAGRALSYVYLPVGYVLAMVAIWPLAHAVRRHAAAAVATTLAAVLFVGGIAVGWPPYWERLPGRYVADGFESGMTAQGVTAARWAGTVLGPGNRIAADFTNDTLLGTYGDQDVVSGANHLFTAPSFEPADAEVVRRLSIDFVMVDLRTTTGPIPPTGYFPDGTSPAPLPRAGLDKFDHIAGVGRIYDAGDIAVYDLRGSRYAP